MKLTSTPHVTANDIERLAYKPIEAAELLGVSRSRLFQLLRSGELESVRYGRTRLIPRSSLERFLNA